MGNGSGIDSGWDHHRNGSASRGKVLVVEDDVMMASLVHRAFEKEGIETIQAWTGEEGLKILESNSSVRVVILDMILPGMDGDDFLKLKHLDTVIQDIPVIVHTGKDQLFLDDPSVKLIAQKSASLKAIVEETRKWI